LIAGCTPRRAAMPDMATIFGQGKTRRLGRRVSCRSEERVG